jgi:hypothetical protein
MTTHKTEDYKNSAVIGTEIQTEQQIFTELLQMRYITRRYRVIYQEATSIQLV